MELARLLVKRGDDLGGARTLHLVPPWWPRKAEATFLEGLAFKRAERIRDAESAWQACLRVDLLHPSPSQYFHGAAKDLVTLYVLEGRLDEARATLWRAYEESTPAERPGVLLTRVRAELERIDHIEAVTKLRAYSSADPDDLDARRALALEEHATGDEDSADRDLDACLKARPDDPSSLLARLDILNDRGDVEAYAEAVRRLPPSIAEESRLALHRGLARQRDGDREAAVEKFRRAVRLAPFDAAASYKLGMAEMALGHATEGREHLARTRQLHQAYQDLRDVYHDFLEQYRRTPRDEAGYRGTVERLATACRQLGWSREADAWLALLPAA